LFVGSATQSVIFELPAYKPLQTLAVMGYTAAWSPDGKQLCSANSSGAATLWDAETGKSLATFVTSGTELHWNRAAPASSGGSSSGGAAGRLVSRGTTDVSGWQPAAAAQQFNYTLARTLPPVWTPNKPIVRGVGTPTLSIWDSATAKKISTLTGHTAAVSAVAWSRDGRTLASASYDKTVRLWEVSTGKLFHTLKDHDQPVYCLAWSPDGKVLASGGADNLVRLWHVLGKPLGTLGGHAGPVTALAWSPRGNLLASGSSDTKVCLWNPDKQHMQLLISAGQPVLSLSFNPDGSILAGGVASLSLRFWQPGNGQLLTQDDARYNTAPRGISSMAWSPDGSALLLASNYSHGMWLWDWREPKVLHAISLLTPSSYVAFTPGAQMMVSGCQDGMARFWDTSSATIRGVILDEADHLVLISATGNYRLDKAYEPEFVFVLQTEKGQEMLSVADFADRYHWKNVPTAVKFSGK
jgi:WD40 repeat protein